MRETGLLVGVDEGDEAELDTDSHNVLFDPWGRVVDLESEEEEEEVVFLRGRRIVSGRL